MGPDGYNCAAITQNVDPYKFTRHSRKEVVMANTRKGWQSWVRDKPRPPKYLDCRNLGRGIRRG